MAAAPRVRLRRKFGADIRNPQRHAAQQQQSAHQGQARRDQALQPESQDELKFGPDEDSVSIIGTVPSPNAIMYSIPPNTFPVAVTPAHAT